MWRNGSFIKIQQAEEIKFWGSDKKCGILVTGKISFVDSMEDLDV